MKIATWRPIARRVAAAAASPDALVVHRRLLYLREARWTVRGVLADGQPYSTGPRVWRLRLPLFGAPLDYLALSWSEDLKDFDGTPESLRQAEYLATEVMQGIESDADGLRSVAYLPAPSSQNAWEQQVCALCLIGDLAGFRRALENPLLVTPARYASADGRREEAARVGRVEAMRAADDDQVLKLLVEWRNESVVALRAAGELSDIEPSMLTVPDALSSVRAET